MSEPKFLHTHEPGSADSIENTVQGGGSTKSRENDITPTHLNNLDFLIDL